MTKDKYYLLSATQQQLIITTLCNVLKVKLPGKTRQQIEELINYLVKGGTYVKSNKNYS